MARPVAASTRAADRPGTVLPHRPGPRHCLSTPGERDGRIVLDSAMETLAERYCEVLVSAEQLPAARALGPIDERAFPFGKTVLLFDGADPSQLATLGETRTPGLADLFVATMKGTYA